MATNIGIRLGRPSLFELLKQQQNTARAAQLIQSDLTQLVQDKTAQTTATNTTTSRFLYRHTHTWTYTKPEEPIGKRSVNNAFIIVSDDYVAQNSNNFNLTINGKTIDKLLDFSIPLERRTYLFLPREIPVSRFLNGKAWTTVSEQLKYLYNYPPYGNAENPGMDKDFFTAIYPLNQVTQSIKKPPTGTDVSFTSVEGDFFSYLSIMCGYINQDEFWLSFYTGYGSLTGIFPGLDYDVVWGKTSPSNLHPFFGYYEGYPYLT